MADKNNTYFIASLLLLLILIIHLSRKDKNFLKINIHRFRTVYSIEYLILSIHLIICLLAYGYWLVLLWVIAGIFLISVIDWNIGAQRRKFNVKIPKLIPADMYEWKTGMRKYFTVLLIIYVSGVCLSYFVAAIPVATALIGFTVMDFFTANESWQILLSFEKSPGKLLFHKINRHALLYAVFNLPLVILFIMFHSNFWYIPVIELIVFLFIHIYMVTVKYAFYRVDGNNGINPVLQLIGVFIGIIPATTPLLLLFSAYFFGKACTNLKPLLHDFD